MISLTRLKSKCDPNLHVKHKRDDCTFFEEPLEGEGTEEEK